MAKNDLYLGPTGSTQFLSPFGRKFTEGEVEISRTERTISGRLVRDVVAVKKKFTLSYDLLDGEDLLDFLELYGLNQELSFDRYTSDTEYVTYSVLMEPMSERARLLIRDTGLWENAVIELNEV